MELVERVSDVTAQLADCGCDCGGCWPCAACCDRCCGAVRRLVLVGGEGVGVIEPHALEDSRPDVSWEGGRPGEEDGGGCSGGCEARRPWLLPRAPPSRLLRDNAADPSNADSAGSMRASSPPALAPPPAFAARLEPWPVPSRSIDTREGTLARALLPPWPDGWYAGVTMTLE